MSINRVYAITNRLFNCYPSNECFPAGNTARKSLDGGALPYINQKKMLLRQAVQEGSEKKKAFRGSKVDAGRVYVVLYGQ